MSQEAAARFSQARIDAITRLGELALEHGADFIAQIEQGILANKDTGFSVHKDSCNFLRGQSPVNWLGDEACHCTGVVDFEVLYAVH